MSDILESSKTSLKSCLDELETINNEIRASLASWTCVEELYKAISLSEKAQIYASSTRLNKLITPAGDVLEGEALSKASKSVDNKSIPELKYYNPDLNQLKEKQPEEFKHLEDSIRSVEIKIVLNRTLAKFKAGKHSEVIKDCRYILDQDPTCIKAYFRWFTALKELNNLAEARTVLCQGLSKNPNNGTLLAALTNLQLDLIQLQEKNENSSSQEDILQKVKKYYTSRLSQIMINRQRLTLKKTQNVLMESNSDSVGEAVGNIFLENSRPVVVEKFNNFLQSLAQAKPQMVKETA